MDRRRLAAAGLSAIIPGLGQAFNRRTLLALLALPSLGLVLAVLVLLQLQSAARLVAWIVAPEVLGALLTLDAIAPRS